MSDTLAIEADWEVLQAGTAEERACFAAIGISYGKLWLTQAEDAFVNRVRDKVHLSGYRLAEWFAWNWWRLRWEPQTRAPDWALAHHMSSIGGGYIWPNITIFSDGERVGLLARSTMRRAAEPLRYVADVAAVVRAHVFEDAIDRYVAQVVGQLRAAKVAETNLDQVWQDVQAERADPLRSSRRKFEALMGFEPDEADEATLNGLTADATTLGDSGMTEIAADRAPGESVMRAAALRELAATLGYDASPRDVVRLDAAGRLSATGEVPAWTRGAEAARALREQERLGDAPIGNSRLARMAGVDPGVLTERTGGARLSFALDTNATNGRVVLRSKWQTGRRFELGRLLGDHVAGARNDRLFPATRAYTYRQKMQRSFAAELLSPFEAVADMLHGDFSEESQIEVARHFDVSELTIRTLLVNHRLIDRDVLSMEAEAVAA
ncbi:MAG TPA: hypothetical protein VND19_23140 [Acetobacteraceae bacterium]|nr:hypothetical protein [Acetobacteraceae bacterium]